MDAPPNTDRQSQRNAGSLSILHPAYLIATWFGAGNLPIAPGTWGSAAAVILAWFIVTLWGPIALIAATVIVTVVGIWAAEVYCRHSPDSDPGPVVVDEVAGQWITLLAVPADLVFYVIGFFLFRLADIVKPWPASWADSKVPGGLGVMLDDVFAGIYAALVLFLLWSFFTGG